MCTFMPILKLLLGCKALHLCLRLGHLLTMQETVVVRFGVQPAGIPVVGEGKEGRKG
jgi:hypothetical protein